MGAPPERTYHVLDRPEVASVLFYPRRDAGVPRLSSGTSTVRIPVAEGVHVGGKIFAAEPGAPVILYFHGNGEIASDYDTIAPAYGRIGVTLFVIDYRGYGISDGSPSASALIEDAWTCFERAPDVLAERKIETGPLFVMGRSLGSAAALEIAARAGDRIGGLIIESGFAYTFSLIERIGFLQLPDSFENSDGFGNLDKIAHIATRTLFIHGERDWIIPIADAEALHEASAATEKSLVRIPGAGHNDLMLVGQRAYFEAIAAFCGRPVPASARG
jgi:pimeloyl-ACP methyl ester carboxylesterase